MEVELSTWQRLVLVGILNGVQGNVGELRKASRVLDTLEMTEEEGKSIGLLQSGNTYAWDPHENTWTVTLTKEDMSYLKGLVEKHPGWQVANREEVFALCEKLEVEA